MSFIIPSKLQDQLNIMWSVI